MSRKPVRKLAVALAGNPNVGKSTLFNALTGLHQHTGNWPGKTVGVAQGLCCRGGTEYDFVDLPGTYSLTGESEDERIAAEYIASGEADCTVVVCDGSSLERSLILALQILEQAERVIVCVNLMDEAERRGIRVDAKKLSECLGAPVVLTSAGQRKGLGELLSEIDHAEPTGGRLWPEPIAAAEEIAAQCVTYAADRTAIWRRKLDQILVSRRFGVPIMLLLLLCIIWMTVWGANVPSELLGKLLDRGDDILKGWL